MTRGISRRKLVAGAAWAAPAVLTSTVVPAYASSAVEQCTDFNPLTYIASDMRNGHKVVVHQVTVPKNVHFMKFHITGGPGGTARSDALDVEYDYDLLISARGGSGASVTGTARVSPGQTVKFYIGASGEGALAIPAAGGGGYTNGGSSALAPETVLSAADNATLKNKDFLNTTIYSGAGGGSSAITLIDPKNPSQETTIAIAGGGGGGGVVASLVGTLDGETIIEAGWDSTSGIRASEGGSTKNTAEAGEEITLRHSFPFHDASFTVPGGAGAAGGTGGSGGAAVTITDDDNKLNFTDTPESLLRTGNTPGAAGRNGILGSGADGVAAYGYALRQPSKPLIPEGSTEVPEGYVRAFNTVGYVVSAGGGGGYGGGGSGTALATGVHGNSSLAIQDMPDIYRVSTNLAGGGGGAGGSFVDASVADARIYNAYNSWFFPSEVQHGTAAYAFCATDSPEPEPTYNPDPEPTKDPEPPYDPELNPNNDPNDGPRDEPTNEPTPNNPDEPTPNNPDEPTPNNPDEPPFSPESPEYWEWIARNS